jgi:hypothetical protein
MQTFHSSSPEQAIRRWTDMHRIPRANILDLDIIVQMTRPQRLASLRYVSRISLVVEENGEPRVRDVYVRDTLAQLSRVVPWESVQLRNSIPVGRFLDEVDQISSELGPVAVSELA